MKCDRLNGELSESQTNCRGGCGNWCNDVPSAKTKGCSA